MNRQRGLAETALLYVIAAMGVALLGALIAIKYLDAKVNRANDQRAAAVKALGEEQESRKQAEAAGKTCSDGVENLAKEGGAARDRALRAAKTAEAGRVAAEQEVQRLLAEHRPPGISEFDNTRKELDDEIDRRHPAR